MGFDLKSALVAGAIGLYVGAGLVSDKLYQTRTLEPFRFDNPVPFNISQEELFRITLAREIIVDTEHYLDFGVFELPLKTTRSVYNPKSRKGFEGVLDQETGDITTPNRIHRLRNIHDTMSYY